MSKNIIKITIVLLVCFASFICFASSIFSGKTNKVVSQSYQEMRNIVISKDMSNHEKIQKLNEFFMKESDWRAILYQISQVDEIETQNIALNLFRNKDTSRKHKLELGRFLLQKSNIPEFKDEYSKFLIDAVLEGGLEEFCIKRERAISAVGEYAFISSDFEGHSSDNFEKIKDKRIIPILVECLNAPDTIYGKEQGCVIRGKPGESTGRNVQRQQIPIALAKLNAIGAIEVLKKSLISHHDYYLRYNSAYALAILMSREDSRVLERMLKKKKEYQQFLFPFGTGLIEKDDGDGVKYMAFKYSAYFKKDSLSSVLYMVEQRLEILKNFKNKKTKVFYKQALEYKPLYNILVFDNKRVKYEGNLRYFDEDKQWKQVTKAEDALNRAKPRIIAIYKDIINGIEINQLEMLAGIISKISNKTRSSEIKKISEEYLNATGR